MSSVMQSDLFSAGSIILFICGVVVFIVSFFGCFGAYRGIRWMLYAVSALNNFFILEFQQMTIFTVLVFVFGVHTQTV